MSIRREATVRRLVMYGLDYPNSVRITDHIKSLVLHNGPEWTVDRLKRIKVAYIQQLAGKTPDLAWIKHKNGIPSGVLKPLFRLKTPQKTLNCLMVYSSLISTKVTPKQWKKFSDSVTKVRETDYCIFPETNTDGITQLSINIQRAYNFNHKIPTMLNSKKRMPDYKHPRFKTVDGSVMTAMNSFGHGLARKFIVTHFYEKLPDWFKSEMTKRWSTILDVQESLDKYDYVGRINFIQEAGFKLRAVANPLMSFQILLEPLKESLLGALKLVPNDFTHDQDSGCAFIQQALSLNRMSSIDLSDATNHLPLKDQIRMLKFIYGTKSPIIDLFEKVSTSKWIVDGPNGEQFLTWETGQPLGLGPSFPCFALYHHFIVRFAYKQAGFEHAVDDLIKSVQGIAPKEDYNYAIVGDDIVLPSPISHFYLSLIEKLECKISESKSIFDSDTAEFCGRIITKSHIYRQYKWTPVSDKSFMDFAKNNGPRCVPLLRTKQRKYVDLISEIPYTLGGVLSWNPAGLPIQVRENKWWKVAYELLSLKDDKDRSIPREELHYELKKGLNLISFQTSPNLNHLIHSEPKSASADLDTISILISSIINTYQDFNYEVIDKGIDDKVLSAQLKEWISQLRPHFSQLNEEERKFMDYIHDIEYNPYKHEATMVGKLYYNVKNVFKRFGI